MNSAALSPEAALMELARRELARRKLIEFTEYTFPQYSAAPHHYLIAEKLEAVERGEIDRLMISVPPRHGKSELSSKRFPAWFLGRNPGKSIIAASYNSDLASDFGREVRNIVDAPEYHAVFSTRLASDSKAANRWHTNGGGAYIAAGVGTAVTGRGADVVLVDDPLKNREEADSELSRQRVWDWYTSTAYTRLAPGGRIVVVTTRWHEDDLTGRLLTAMENGGDRWEVMVLPAINADGEALWPDRYSKTALERIKANIGTRDWSALYQQSPAPDEGLYFKRDMMRFYTVPPQHLRFYGASDYAVTADGGDYTVHAIVGVDPDDNIYIIDIWRKRSESNVWIDAFCDLIKRYKPLKWAEEQGQILKSLGPFIDRRQRETKAYCAREQFTSAADKATRSRSFQARMAMGKVYFPTLAPWMGDLEAELFAFPAGKNDDQVDSLGLVGRLLDQMVGGRVPPKSAHKEDRWGKAFARAERGQMDSWKVA